MAFYRQSLRILNRCVSLGVGNSSVTEPRYIKRWVAPTLHELYKRRREAGPEPPSHRSTYLEWNYDAEVFAFAKRLGEEFDDRLLRRALTHRSYVINQNLKQNQDDAPEISDNKDLVSKGEKLIYDYLTAELKGKHPDVLLKIIRDHLTKMDMLAKVASDIGLKDIVLCADFPVEQTTLSDSFKAIVAALEISSGGDRARLFVQDFLVAQLTGKDIYDDLWNLEQPFEYLKNLVGGNDVEPRLCNQSATNTILASYQVGLYSKKQLLGIGFGESLEIAKNTAAMDAIKKIYAGTSNKKYLV